MFEDVSEEDSEELEESFYVAVRKLEFLAAEEDDWEVVLREGYLI